MSVTLDLHCDFTVFRKYLNAIIRGIALSFIGKERGDSMISFQLLTQRTLYTDKFPVMNVEEHTYIYIYILLGSA